MEPFHYIITPIEDKLQLCTFLTQLCVFHDYLNFLSNKINPLSQQALINLCMCTSLYCQSFARKLGLLKIYIFICLYFILDHFIILRLCLHGTGSNLLWSFQNGSAKTGPVLDPFGSVPDQFQTVPCKHLDRFQTVPCLQTEANPVLFGLEWFRSTL